MSGRTQNLWNEQSRIYVKKSLKISTKIYIILYDLQAKSNLEQERSEKN